jgi:hypothetical protein
MVRIVTIPALLLVASSSLLRVSGVFFVKGMDRLRMLVLVCSELTTFVAGPICWTLKLLSREIDRDRRRAAFFLKQINQLIEM